MAYAGDLKSIFRFLQRPAPKRSAAKSPLFTIGSHACITHGCASKRIKLQTRPTPLPTPEKGNEKQSKYESVIHRERFTIPIFDRPKRKLGYSQKILRLTNFFSLAVFSAKRLVSFIPMAPHCGLFN
jgi:hypothetical protein